MPGLAAIGSLETGRIAAVHSESLAEVGVGRGELDSEVVPA